MTLTPEEIDTITGEILARLGETDHGPMRQVRMIVEHAGEEFARDMLKETVELEATGGILTADGTRRRTAGGVYFYVVKGKLEPTLRQIIFPGYGQVEKGVSIEWDQRDNLVNPIVEAGDFGMMTMAPRITLYGRAKHIEKLENSFLMILENSLEPAAYARGVPTPPSEPTLFSVYMGRGQYERISKMLRRNPKDSIIVEGTCMYDKQTGTIAVFALTVSSRYTEKKLRSDPKSPAISGADNETAILLPGKPSVPPNPRKEIQQDKKAKEAARLQRMQPKQAKAPQPAKEKATKPQSQPAKPAPSATPKQVAPAKPKPEGASQQPPKRAPEIKNDAPFSPLQELELAATTLRERLATMEAKKLAGTTTTRRLLDNTERQIEALKREVEI